MSHDSIRLRCDEEMLQDTKQEMKSMEEARLEQAIAVKQAIIEHLERNVEDLQQKLANQNRTYDEKVMELSSQLSFLTSNLQRHTEALISTTTSQIEAKAARDDSEEEDEIRREAEAAAEARWEHEIEGHREQARQHARTICVLEERLTQLAKETSEAKSEVQQLTALRNEWEKQLASDHPEFRCQGVQASSPMEHVGANNSRYEIQAVSCETPIKINDVTEVIMLRNEVDALNAIRQCQRKEIDKLRQEVAEAEARASDAISCACQAHKEEAEAALNFGQEVSQKLEESRSQVQQLNSALDALKQNLEEKERALVKAKATAQAARDGLNAESDKVGRLQTELLIARELSSSKAQPHRPVASSPRMLNELANLGAICQAEDHPKVIAGQRNALTELRQRLHHLAGSGASGLSTVEFLNLEESHRRDVLHLQRQLKVLRSQTNACHGSSISSSHDDERLWLEPINVDRVDAREEPRPRFHPTPQAESSRRSDDASGLLELTEKSYRDLVGALEKFLPSITTAFDVRRSCLRIGGVTARRDLFELRRIFATAVEDKLALLFGQLRKNAAVIQAFEAELFMLRGDGTKKPVPNTKGDGTELKNDNKAQPQGGSSAARRTPLNVTIRTPLS